MELIFGLAFLGAYGTAIIWSSSAVLRSIANGFGLLRKTYGDRYPNKTARRILAWNLIEPSLTAPNILGLLLYERHHPTGMLANIKFNKDNLAEYLLALGIYCWPMIIMFVVVPLIARFSADPAVRWASRNSAINGIIRLSIIGIMFPTIGIGMLIGAPYLNWSIKKSVVGTTPCLKTPSRRKPQRSWAVSRACGPSLSSRKARRRTLGYSWMISNQLSEQSSS